jgi:uncharacterized membrane protein
MLPAAATVIESLAHSAQRWKDLYDDTTPLSVGVTYVHLASLLVGGGIALATDRATLRAGRGAAPDRERHLAELGLTHRAVIGGLVVSFLSGVLLFLADVDTFATSIAFWVKMGLVALLLLNGVVMTRIESALRRRAAEATGAGAERGEDAILWQRLRVSAGMSVALWMTTLLAGVALTSV